MLGVLGLGVCIASISCLCCLCTSTLVYLPRFIDVKTGKYLSVKEERKRQLKQVELQNDCSVGCCGIQSGECPCNIKYVLNPVLIKKTIFPSETCNRTSRKKFCVCPSLLDLVESENDNF